MSIVSIVCSHKKRIVYKCEKEDTVYKEKCRKCGKIIERPKAQGEMFIEGTSINYV